MFLAPHAKLEIPEPMRVVGKIMVPFGVLKIIRHLIFRVPNKGP